MSLFTINQPKHPTTLNSLSLQTPLGEVFFNCEISDKSLLTTHPTEIETFKSTNFISSWVFDDYIAEFIRLSFTQNYPQE